MSYGCPMHVQCMSNVRPMGNELTSNECPPKPSVHEASETPQRYNYKPAASMCCHRSAPASCFPCNSPGDDFQGPFLQVPTCAVPATSGNTPFTPMFNGTPQLVSRTNNYKYITPAGKVIGRPLDAHWTPIGHRENTVKSQSHF